MKKILICLLLLLSACSVSDDHQIVMKEVAVDEDIALRASEKVSEGDEIGKGTMAYEYGEGLKEASYAVYPVYLDDEITGIYSEEKGYIILDEDLYELMNSHDSYVFVDIDGVLYYYDNENVCPATAVYESLGDVLKDYVIVKGEEVKDERIELIRKKIITGDTIFIDGVEFASDRITVVFKKGDIDQMIKDYEDYCKGELHSVIDSLAYYTFSFGKMNIIEIKELLKGTLDLPYVEDAWLNEVFHTTGVEGAVTE